MEGLVAGLMILSAVLALFFITRTLVKRASQINEDEIVDFAHQAQQIASAETLEGMMDITPLLTKGERENEE